MNTLLLREGEVTTVFDLLGYRENDITFAIGFGVARSPAFLEGILGAIGAPTDVSEPITIDLQRGDRRDRGYTDIELRSEKTLHAIVEAKRGWNLPTSTQLDRYRQRLDNSNARDRRYVVLTQWGLEHYVRHKLGATLASWPIATLGLGQVAMLAAETATRERRPVVRNTLTELGVYLKGVASMRDLHDNRVYVVSLSANESPDLPGYTTIEIAQQRGLYWFPADGRSGWPKEPPNYLGFRYDGRLQSVHHVDEYNVSFNLAEDVPGAKTRDDVPRFVVKLGPPIRPAHPIRSGPIRDTRIWAEIDLLLTSETVQEAREQTRQRHAVPPR